MVQRGVHPRLKYLTVYEFEHEKVSESEAWKAHQFGHPWTRRIRRAMRLDEGSPGVYRRIYPAL